MNTDSLRAILSQSVNMDDEAWDASLHLFKPKTLNKKEHFLKQGETCKHIGFIVSGYVRLYYDIGDTEITKDFNTEHTFCGSYASFISEKPSHFNVVAMEPLELLIINRNNLILLTEQYMAWQKFLRIAMERMFITKENREAFFLTTTPEERYSILLSETPEWVNRIPLKHLASYLGMTAETLSRIRAKK